MKPIKLRLTVAGLLIALSSSLCAFASPEIQVELGVTHPYGQVYINTGGNDCHQHHGRCSKKHHKRYRKAAKKAAKQRRKAAKQRRKAAKKYYKHMKKHHKGYRHH